jgi:RNA-directed DNA polymerase
MDINKIRNEKRLCIIDDRVFNSDDENVALPKDDFADYVLKQVPGFDDLDHSEFSKIFDIIYKIIIGHNSEYPNRPIST